MKVGLVSDSPTVTTGFGLVARHLADGLVEARHEVACFGLKGRPEARTGPHPWTVWPVDPASLWGPTLERFLREERIEAVVVNMDVFNLQETIGYIERSSWKGRSVGYVIFDGLPAYRSFTDRLRWFQRSVASTRASAGFLESRGLGRALVVPPGVDMTIFAPLPQRDALRREAGLTGKFVVGVFGRNTERKQQPRVLQALRILNRRGAGEGVLAYFHCQMHGYWRLDEMAEALQVRDQALFPRLTDETKGVPYSRAAAAGRVREPASQAIARMPDHFSYVERLNVCDMVVNAPHCGDFEQALIEAQACGVPVAGTDDEGIMAEAMGPGGLPLPAERVFFGRAGQLCHYVSAEAVAEAILTVREDAARRQGLIAEGLKNAALYPWRRLKTEMAKALEFE